MVYKAIGMPKRMALIHGQILTKVLSGFLKEMLNRVFLFRKSQMSIVMPILLLMLTQVMVIILLRNILPLQMEQKEMM